MNTKAIDVRGERQEFEYFWPPIRAIMEENMFGRVGIKFSRQGNPVPNPSRVVTASIAASNARFCIMLRLGGFGQQTLTSMSISPGSRVPWKSKGMNKSDLWIIRILRGSEEEEIGSEGCGAGIVSSP